VPGQGACLAAERAERRSDPPGYARAATLACRALRPGPWRSHVGRALGPADGL